MTWVSVFGESSTFVANDVIKTERGHEVCVDVAYSGKNSARAWRWCEVHRHQERKMRGIPEVQKTLAKNLLHCSEWQSECTIRCQAFDAVLGTEVDADRARCVKPRKSTSGDVVLLCWLLDVFVV